MRGLSSCIETRFVCDLQQEAKQLFDEYIATPRPMLLTATELPSFNNATTCHIYTKPLGDHCHIVGSYHGTAHSECNLRISKSSWKLTVVIHNLKGYDGHLIVKALKGEFGKVRVIPQDMEKYFSLTVGQLKFVDYFQFTPHCLDGLVKTLADDEFRYMRESCTSNHFSHIRRKVVYPYDYMDNFDRFDETELPSQDAFFSKLSGSPCSDSEYTHATRVWTASGCRQ